MIASLKPRSWYDGTCYDWIHVSYRKGCVDTWKIHAYFFFKIDAIYVNGRRVWTWLFDKRVSFLLLSCWWWTLLLSNRRYTNVVICYCTAMFRVTLWHISFLPFDCSTIRDERESINFGVAAGLISKYRLSEYATNRKRYTYAS